MSKRTPDPTIEIVAKAISSAFPAHNPNVRLTRRRKAGGYTISVGYSAKKELPPIRSDDIYSALAKRLVALKDGVRTTLTIEEIKQQFKVTYLMGISGVHYAGSTTMGLEGVTERDEHGNIVEHRPWRAQ